MSAWTATAYLDGYRAGRDGDPLVIPAAYTLAYDADNHTVTPSGRTYAELEAELLAVAQVEYRAGHSAAIKATKGDYV